MKRIPSLIVVSVVLAAVAPSSASAATPKLIGTTGPGFTITLKRNGVKVRTLKARKYTLVVRDRSSIHNFRIKGRGLNRAVTTVPFIGTRTVTIALRVGRYTFQCDPHALTGMRGTFRVVA